MIQTLEQLIATDAQPKKVAGGFRFTEGPAADSKGNIFFVDIGNNRIHCWEPKSEQLSTVREDSGGADGMFVGPDGALWICEMNAKQISKINPDGAYSVVHDSFEGEPFTGCNDLWFDGQGGLYFTDSYGGHEDRGNETRLFYRSPTGELSLLADDYYKSNGLHGSPDFHWLYVADYLDDKIYRYEIGQPGQLGERTLFAEVRCDGMTVDELGNLYLCTGNYGQGVVVVDPSGETMGAIDLPEDAHNICFGGPGNRTLFITATSGLYTLAMAVGGAHSVSPRMPVLDVGGLDRSHQARRRRAATHHRLPHCAGTGRAAQR